MTRLKLTPTEYSNFLPPPPGLPFTQLREASEKALDKWALDANGFVTEYKPRVDYGRHPLTLAGIYGALQWIRAVASQVDQRTWLDTTSYGLKHTAERWLVCDMLPTERGSGYLANGEFIVAAVVAGLKPIQHRDSVNRTPNCCFARGGRLPRGWRYAPRWTNNQAGKEVTWHLPNNTWRVA